jgi:putative peptidoglycan lipid II flippase
VSLVKNTAVIGGLTLVSRILGLVRDTLSARYLGAGLANDAFQVAWRLPNLFRALFAEGAFASAFVPMFNRSMAEAANDGEDGLKAAITFAGHVLSVLFPFLLAFTILMMVYASPIVWGMTGGFPDGGPGKVELSITLTRITFPYLGLISIVSLLGGILNSLNRFWVNAAAPVLLNICMITALLFFRGANQMETAQTQAIAVTISGLAQLLWLIWSCRRAGVVLRIGIPHLTPQVRQMLVVIWPAALGAGALQFNQVVSTMLASRFLPQGSISYLYFADRLNQLPLGLIGIGVGTAILPSLSRQIRSGTPEVAQHTQNRAIELAFLLAMPAAVALVISAVPITRGVFQNGAFHASDTVICAAALAAFSVGVPAYVLIKVLTPGFYARQDTKTPVRIAVFSMLVNLVGNLILIWPLQIVGVTIATAFAAWVNVGLLYRELHRRNHLRMDTQLLRSIRQVIGASIVMGAALWWLNPIVDPHVSRGLIERGIWLGVLVGGGGAVYLVTGVLLGAVSWQMVKTQFLRRG